MNDVIVIDDDDDASSENERFGVESNNLFHQPVEENPIQRIQAVLGETFSLENLHSAYSLNGQDVPRTITALLDITGASLRPMLAGFQHLAEQSDRAVDLNCHEKGMVSTAFQLRHPELDECVWFKVAKHGVEAGCNSITVETPRGNSLTMFRPNTRKSRGAARSPQWTLDEDIILMTHHIFNGTEFEDIIIEGRTTDNIKVSLHHFNHFYMLV
jgi:hypothetical protein